MGTFAVFGPAPARRFFTRQGFNVAGRRDFEIAGTPIHNYAMEKKL